MTNLHAPQRLENESREAYRSRRKASQHAARAARFGLPNIERFHQHTNPEKHDMRAARKAAKFSGAQPKPLRVRAHKPKQAIDPTWPKSKDQRKQSRPLIVCHPLRALRAKMLAAAVPDKDGVRSLTAAQESLLKHSGTVYKSALDRSAA